MIMPLPDLTHLQFLVLAALMEGERSGRDIRGRLSKEGIPKSGPAFYQLMARMEEAGLVEGRYADVVIDDQVVKERRYTITGTGEVARERALDFYRRHGAIKLKGGIAHA
jgi:DNA-binding PadR family transcriptional regulator